MRYIVLYKPFGTLCQFTKEMPDDVTLADVRGIPPDVYPVGRLDKDSEGLLILTNDKSLNAKLLNPNNAHWRTYWAHVEGIPDENHITQLKKGVTIRVNKKKHLTLPARCKAIPPPLLPERKPPVRFRKTVPDSWIEISLMEGKNRQVRKMCANVGFPVLRLVRVKIEDLSVGDLQPGEWTEVDRNVLFRLLHLGR